MHRRVTYCCRQHCKVIDITVLAKAAGIRSKFQSDALGAAFIRDEYVLESSVLVGTDLVRIGDVADAIRRHGDRYLQRIYTDLEITYCNSAPHLASERFAARFAAKEATTKLLRVRTDKLLWRTIEVKRAAGGWCDIVLRAEAKDLADAQGIVGFSLSMSHEHEYALATVVAQRMTERHTGAPRTPNSRD
jgi:holo-[acyl-carrier protein] synthase